MNNNSVDPFLVANIVGTIFVICIFISAGFYFLIKHKERLLLIEKGLKESEVKKSNGNSLQKIGIIIIALSLGIMIVSALHGTSMELPEGVEVAIIGISGGLGMIYANRLDKKS